MRATLQARSAAAITWVVSNVGVDELLLAVALGLIAVGLWSVWRPGAYLVPGLVLLWIVMPARAPFLTRPPAPSEKHERRLS
jgi:hypothetical protein